MVKISFGQTCSELGYNVMTAEECEYYAQEMGVDYCGEFGGEGAGESGCLNWGECFEYMDNPIEQPCVVESDPGACYCMSSACFGGCTDESAENYNADANYDDGSCTYPPTCDDGYVVDCADDDCCPDSWIGDGYGDCEDQAFGCDLTCYDNDDGDCAPACPDGEVECWDGSCATSEGDCPDAPDCSSSFMVYGSDSTGEFYDGNCYSDGSAYFILDWEGGCLAEYLEWEDETGYANGMDISSNGFTGGFLLSGFNPGGSIAVIVVFAGGASGFGSADADCTGDGGTDGGSETCADCEFDFTAYGSECCDTVWDEYGISCADLEANYYWDCSGCNCPGDSGGDDGGTDGGGECADGTVEDCSGDGDCAPDSWVGDGWCDGTDEPYGYNLTCYDNDGGDCDGRRADSSKSIKLNTRNVQIVDTNRSLPVYTKSVEATHVFNISEQFMGKSIIKDMKNPADVIKSGTSSQNGGRGRLGNLQQYQEKSNSNTKDRDCFVIGPDADCAGVCFGDSLIDDCDDCSSPDDYNSDQDCAGVCFGDSLIDDCGVCDGPGSIYQCGCYNILDGECDCEGNIDDCAGECGGYAEEDYCGVCNGDNVANDCGDDGGGECVNDDSSTDAYGDTCSSWYDVFESPGSYGCSGGYDDDDFNAAEQCCACQRAASPVDDDIVDSQHAVDKLAQAETAYIESFETKIYTQVNDGSRDDCGGTGPDVGCDGVCFSGLEDVGCGCGEPLNDVGCCGDASPTGCDNTCGSELVEDACGVCGGDNSSCSTTEYCVGDIVSDADQARTFNVCYPCEECEGWSLFEHTGDIIFIDMSASWCAPCFSSIGVIDELEEYWSNVNSNVKFITALADIGNPYSCNQWGNAGLQGAPTIVEDDGTIFDWFKDTNAQYPNYVILDHEMRVRAKPSGIFSNSNIESCDGGESLDGQCLNSIITSLLDECGQTCSESFCNDTNACNYGDNADCIFPIDDSHDCCGECIADVDCFGICGGSATEEDCLDPSSNCPTCTIVCHPDDDDCEGDFTSIQEAIDFVADGDTVLVNKGTYYENLILQKPITLTSRAIFDDLDGWVGYEDEYVILNDNINNTIIDGSMDINGEGLESTILITSPDECITPLIFGFTIQGGSGTIVLRENEEGINSRREEIEMNVGGGFLSLNALPTFHYNQIRNNTQDDDESPLYSGGGGDQSNGDQIRISKELQGYDLSSTRSDCNGDIDLSYNLWSDNGAYHGNTIGSTDFYGSIDMSNSIFDIYNCLDQEVGAAWVDVEENVDVNFENGVGDLCSIVEDVYVSPYGDDNNLGISQAEAFLTINRALEMIAPQNDNPITIFLAEGIFSPSTGEQFPIVLNSHVNLIGQGEEVTKLDAGNYGCAESLPYTLTEMGMVIKINYSQNNFISNLTITGGCNFGSGGGIALSYANVILSNLTIDNNVAEFGGGIYLASSNATLINSTISNNVAFELNGFENVGMGGGMGIVRSDTKLNQVLFKGNSAFHAGGGMYIWNSNSILSNVSIVDCFSFKGSGIAVYSWQNDFLKIENSILWPEILINDPDCQADYNGGDCILHGIWLDQWIAEYYGSGWENNALLQIDYSDIAITDPYGYMQEPFYHAFYNGEENYSIDPNYNSVSCDVDYLGNPPFLYILQCNDDYILQDDSPCINAGNPNLWYNDLDGTRSDMGATGGLFVIPNFISHDFSLVSELTQIKQFSLFNYRETPIIINSVNFETTSFIASTSFPITIHSLETGIIDIQTNLTLGSDYCGDSCLIKISFGETCSELGYNVMTADECEYFAQEMGVDYCGELDGEGSDESGCLNWGECFEYIDNSIGKL